MVFVCGSPEEANMCFPIKGKGFDLGEAITLVIDILREVNLQIDVNRVRTTNRREMEDRSLRCQKPGKGAGKGAGKGGEGGQGDGGTEEAPPPGVPHAQPLKNVSRVLFFRVCHVCFDHDLANKKKCKLNTTCKKQHLDTSNPNELARLNKAKLAFDKAAAARAKLAGK